MPIVANVFNTELFYPKDAPSLASDASPAPLQPALTRGAQRRQFAPASWVTVLPPKPPMAKVPGWVERQTEYWRECTKRMPASAPVEQFGVQLDIRGAGDRPAPSFNKPHGVRLTHGA